MSETAPPRLRRWAATLAIGAAGGALASAAGAPLPWLLGALFSTGLAAAGGARPFGAPPGLPLEARLIFVPVIGVLIGASLTPETVAAAPRWWPTLLAVLVFVPLAHAAAYAALRRIGGLDRPTAFFSAMPGGLIEAIELGSEKGGDARMLALIQFARIAIVVTLAPVLFSLAEGRAVGSAAGARMAAGAPLGAGDAILLFAAGALGVLIARRLRAPAAPILGPVLLSGAMHALGWTAAAPPDALVTLAQLVIGVTLGQRFAGVDRAMLARALALSLGAVAAMAAAAVVLSLALSAVAPQPIEVLLLSYAPGGLVEMGLIALSLEASPIFVTLHHLVRILATVGMATAAWRLIERR